MAGRRRCEAACREAVSTHGAVSPVLLPLRASSHLPPSVSTNQVRALQGQGLSVFPAAPMSLGKHLVKGSRGNSAT